jgi:hypothetical protein
MFRSSSSSFFFFSSASSTVSQGKSRRKQQKEEAKKEEGERMHTSMLTAVVVCVLAHSKMSAAHKKEKKKKKRDEAGPAFFFFGHSYNANDDTTFTSNYLLVNFSSLQEPSLSLSSRGKGGGGRETDREMRKEERPLWAFLCALTTMRTQKCNENSEKAREKRRDKKERIPFAVSPFFFLLAFVLYRCGLCLKRSHTVLDTIHTVAAVVQRPVAWSPQRVSHSV